METALHGHDIDTTQLSKDKLAAVPLHRRDRKVWYFLIRKLVCISYF
jgi:hypothetical protein